MSLLLVPAGYVFIEDIQKSLKWLYGGLVWLYSPLPKEEVVAAGSPSITGGTLLRTNGFSIRPSAVEEAAEGTANGNTDSTEQTTTGGVQRGPRREDE
jgi:hypothetical protein